MFRLFFLLLLALPKHSKSRSRSLPEWRFPSTSAPDFVSPQLFFQRRRLLFSTTIIQQQQHGRKCGAVPTMTGTMTAATATQFRIPRGGGDSSSSSSTNTGRRLRILFLENFGQWIGDKPFRCWTALFFAISMDISSTMLTKWASDTNDPTKVMFAMILYNTSLLCFAACLAKIEVSVAYAVWSALGTALVSMAGIFWGGERCNMVKILSILMIVIGVVGLNLSDSH